MLLVNVAKHFYFNRQHAKLSRQRLHQLQADQFSKLVQFVAVHSPYYQTVIKKYHINSTKCQPQDFPILTKTDVIANFDHIVTNPQITKAKIAAFLEHSHDPRDLFLHKYHVVHTSGSSGIVGYYVYSQEELARGVAGSIWGNGVKLFQKFAYVAAANGHFAGVTMAQVAKKMPLIYQQVRMFDSNLPFQHMIDGLNDMQPTTLSGYVFILRKLAQAQQTGKLRIKPQVLQSGGEPLPKRDKDYIQNIFGVPLINVYAASEHMIMGIGRDDFNGMYLMEDNLLFEIEPTHTLVTNLFNYTLPLIRYQMTDRLQPIADTTNHLPFTKVANIVGRTEHIPVFLNSHGEEDFIRPLVLADIVVEHVNQLQMKIIDKQHFVLNVCLQPNISKKQKDQAVQTITREIRALLNEKLLSNVQFTIELVDQLWADPKTGKFSYIVKDKT